MSLLVRAFESLPLWAGAIIVVGGFTVLSVLLARLTQRLFRREVLIEHNDLTGFIFAVVGVIYAVLLGFVAIGVWERFAAADEATYAEAGNLTIVYRDAGAFRERDLIRKDLRAYVADVSGPEWAAMQRGDTSRVVRSQAERLAFEVNHATPDSAKDDDLRRQMIDAMSEALMGREHRLAVDATGLNSVMWAVVILGGFITVTYTFLFGFRVTHMQTAMVGILALLIGLVIFLTMSLDYPFQGSVRVRPDAFEQTLATFDAIDQTR